MCFCCVTRYTVLYYHLHFPVTPWEKHKSTWIVKLWSRSKHWICSHGAHLCVAGILKIIVFYSFIKLAKVYQRLAGPMKFATGAHPLHLHRMKQWTSFLGKNWRNPLVHQCFPHAAVAINFHEIYIFFYTGNSSIPDLLEDFNLSWSIVGSY